VINLDLDEVIHPKLLVLKTPYNTHSLSFSSRKYINVMDQLMQENG
jgi:hypothetical protein